MNLERLIFERIETRILVGITMFVGILVLVGWVAINENARMASFERQFLARSIERGAYLFAANCSTCHGHDGRGLAGRAPGLNNPHFFGYNFLATTDRQITNLTREEAALYAAYTSGDYSATGLSPEAADARLGVGSIPFRLAEIDRELETIDARLAEIDGLIGPLPEPEADAAPDAAPDAEATPESSAELSEVAAQVEATPEATAAPEAAAEATAEAPAMTEAEIAALEAERQELLAVKATLEAERDSLNEEQNALEAELAGGGLTPEREAEINARLGTGTVYADLDAAQAERESLLARMDSVVNREEDPYNPAQPSRLSQVSWNGTLEDYIFTTLVHGRPGSGLWWPASNGGMVAWAQTAGGPLRPDEVQDLTNFILNWDRGDQWSIEDDLLAVNQFARIPGAATAAAMGPTLLEAYAADPAAIVADLPTVTGDAANGERLYNRLGCAGCHEGGAVGPLTAGTWTRAQSERLLLPQYAGYTVEQYIVESIVNPSAYLVPPYTGGMPGNFAEQLDLQGMADILAYIEGQG